LIQSDTRYQQEQKLLSLEEGNEIRWVRMSYNVLQYALW